MPRKHRQPGIQCPVPNCKGWCMKGRDKCFFHLPYMQERAQAARVLGGKAQQGKKRRRKAKKANTFDGIARLAASLVDDLHRGKVTVREANVVKSILAVSLKALEATKIEARLKALEKGNSDGQQNPEQTPET